MHSYLLIRGSNRKDDNAHNDETREDQDEETNRRDYHEKDVKAEEEDPEQDPQRKQNGTSRPDVLVRVVSTSKVRVQTATASNGADREPPLVRLTQLVNVQLHLAGENADLTDSFGMDESFPKSSHHETV